jgi:hypothetical protein
LLALYSVAFIAACGGLLALTWNEDKKLDITVRHFNLQAFIDATDSNRVVFTVLLAPFVLLGVVTLVVAFWIESAASKGVLRMRQTDGGTVEVTATAIETLLRDALNRQPEIHRSSPRVRLSGGAVDTDIAVVIEPSASIANITGLVAQTTADVLKQQVGVSDIRRPNIRISYDEIAARPAGAGAPGGATAPPVPPVEPAKDEEQPESNE